MDAVAVIVAISAVMLASGVAGFVLAGVKNRGLSTWVAWCFLFPPSLLVLLMLPKLSGPRPRQRSLDEEDRMHP